MASSAAVGGGRAAGTGETGGGGAATTGGGMLADVDMVVGCEMTSRDGSYDVVLV